MLPKPVKRNKKVRSMKDLFLEIWNERIHQNPKIYKERSNP